MTSSTLTCSRCLASLSTTLTPRGATPLCERCRTIPSLATETPADSAATSLPRPTNASTDIATPDAGTVDWQKSGQVDTVEHITSERRAASLPAGEIPGFELLEVLGRGGMGVVYKGRHLKLNRLVALKMILAGEHAGPEQIERFLAEARAVAKLQHGNIVQVFEVGEHHGLPYLALEFVAGGSLAHHWRHTKPTPDDAAALVETLARAMHAAHQCGIIHRDLKPANILLAADATPKIGDFGLAKQVDDGLQTASGAVMGTPSFMAPEQALGQSRNVGPATDVYALGAILYNGLTGKPPFRGETTMDILMQVTGEEARPPSQLVAGLPRDLETICLKCLQKAPAERYASAEALAEDLRRFRQGEPIKARPAGFGERLWKWVRRRPAWAAVFAMTFLVAVLTGAVIIIRQQADQVQEQADKQREISRLVQDIDGGLAQAVWTRGHIERLETQLNELERLAPEQARAARLRLHPRLAEVIRDFFSVAKKPSLAASDLPAIEEMIQVLNQAVPELARPVRIDFHKRLAESIRESFSIARKPVLHAEDAPPIEAMIRLLAERDAELAQAVTLDFQGRRGNMQIVMNLESPFKDLKHLFSAPFEEKDKALFAKAAKGKPNTLILSQVPCTRHVEMDAVLKHSTWDIRGPVGIVVQGAGRDKGYFFLVEPAEIPGAEGSSETRSLTFAEAVRHNAPVSLRIQRNKHRLHEIQVPAAKLWASTARDGLLRLKAKRAGERLLFYCNDVKLEFEDSLPLSHKEGGVFGLQLPASVGVRSMKAIAQDVPAVLSPLERGDEFYGQERFAEALLEYQTQAQSSRDPKIRSEARFKEALCYLAEKDEGNAAAKFEALATDPATMERWQILASCQLWGLRLKQGKEKEADAIFRSLNPRYRVGELAVFLPDHLRDTILHHYWYAYQTGLSHLMAHPKLVPSLERAVEVQEYFQIPREQRQLSRFYLFRAYAKTNKPEAALATAAGLFKEAPLPTLQAQAWWLPLCEEYTLLLRLEKQADRALTELDAKLFTKKGVYRQDCLTLLLERASIHASLERWDDAEADVNAFFERVKSGDVPARVWSRACLARGLLRERKGDKKGALDAWRLGLARNGSKLDWHFDRASPMGLVQQAVLASLCDEFPDAEVSSMIDQLMKQMGGYASGIGFKEAARMFLPELNPEVLGPVLRGFPQDAEGRAQVRQIAFREKSIPDLYRDVLVTGFVDLGQRLLAPHRLSADELKLARHLANDGYTAFSTGKLGRSNLLELTQLAALFRNQTSFLGWNFSSKKFEPHLRGPMAYFFALRYLHVFNKPGEAATYFQRALELAPQNSDLRRLATAELERLKKKK